MNEIMTPVQFLITTVAWWVNEWQAKRIEFLCREIEVYRRLGSPEADQWRTT